jgi:phosphatidylglycerophosphate synthase
MTNVPYDQRIARVLVRPLARLGAMPNQVTGLSLLLALAAGGLFAFGEAKTGHWAAGIFVLARFLDHFDGELARLTGKSSRLGYYFDYLAGGLSYAALFAGLGVGLAGGALGVWALVLGLSGAAAALVSLVLNLDLDRQQGLAEGEAVGYPGLAGFELEDGIYLLAPVTWLGWLVPFFVAAGIGAALYCLWTLGRVVRARLSR